MMKVREEVLKEWEICQKKITNLTQQLNKEKNWWEKWMKDNNHQTLSIREDDRELTFWNGTWYLPLVWVNISFKNLTQQATDQEFKQHIREIYLFYRNQDDSDSDFGSIEEID